MRINLSTSEAIELIGVCVVLCGAIGAFVAWYVENLKEEILAECKVYMYILQERITGNEIEINHLNNHAEKAWPSKFQRLILSIRRRNIDDVRQ